MSTKSIISLAVLFILGSFQVSGSAPSWERAELAVGSLSSSGGLHLRIPLGNLSGSPEFGFPVYLEHGLRQRGTGGYSAVSEWQVPQLMSWAGPQGRDEVHWREPGGTVHIFKNADLLKRVPAAVATGWVAVADGGSGDYTFVSAEGWRYTYRGGAIISLESPGGRLLTFKTDRGRIVTVKQQGFDQPLLEANYDRDGILQTVRVGPHEYTLRRNRDLLLGMESSLVGSEPWRFQYGQRLLTGLRLPDGTIRTFEWTKDLSGLGSEYGLKQPRGAPAAILVADDRYQYRFGVNRDGINLVRIDALGRRDGISYNPKTHEVVHRNHEGGERITIWNGNRAGEGSVGKLREVRAPDGRVLLAQKYDSDGRLTARKQAGRATELFHYDSSGRLSHIGRPGMTRWSLEYDADRSSGHGRDQPVKVTNALGDWMAFEYDAHGQVTRYRDLDGHEHRFEYDPLGRLVRHILPTGHSHAVEYDDWGRVVGKTAADGSTTRIDYTDNGRIAGVSDGHDTLSFVYDEAGRMVERLRNGEMDGRLEHARTAEGRVIEAVDSLGREFTAEFDADGKLVGRSNGRGWAVAYTYDSAGQLSGWTDARGVGATFERDAGGRVSSFRNSLGQGLDFTWDIGGKLRLRESGEQAVRYKYDREGRLVEANYGGEERVKYVYDDWGRLARAETGDVISEYAYDAMDRVTGVRETLPDGQRQTLAVQYTPGGRRASVSLMRESPGSGGMLAGTQFAGLGGGRVLQVTDYTYDALGRVVSISVDGEARVAYRYDPETLRLHSKRFSNGTGFVYQYDSRGRIAGQLAYDAFGGLIKGVSYEWDQHGRLASRTFNAFDFTYRDGNGMLTGMSLSGNPADQRVEQHYRYDADGRLESVTSPQRPELNEHYTYDASGNITEKTVAGETVRMTYDLANQIVSRHSDEGLRTFDYDSAGRMVGEQLNGEQVASYSYGYLDKVVSVTRDGQRTDFHYNASGMLVGKSQSGSRLEPWQWHGLGLVARGDQLYLNEDHTTGSIGSPQVGGAALMSRTAGGKDEQFLMTDYLGTTLGAVDTDGHHSNPQEGTEIGRANLVRTSFGNGAAAASASERFTGKPYDADLGAHVFPYRNYRADLGRWMSADPINFPDGPNQHYYAPVPTMGVDPWGLLNWDTLFDTGDDYLMVHPSGPQQTMRYFTIETDDGNYTINMFRNNNPSGNPGFTTNCHGYTFAGGNYWINTDQVSNILDGDGYVEVTSGDYSKVSVAVWAANGGHSAKVVDADKASVNKVRGLGGLQVYPTTTSPSGAWVGSVKYYEN